MPKYHLHIDATRFESELAKVPLDRLGFSETNFSHLDERYEHYEPEIHYTLKADDLGVIKSRFTELQWLLSDAERFTGYLEAEFIAIDEELEPPRRANEASPLPFRASKRPLDPGQFRQSEIHVTMLVDCPDAPVCDAMREMGYFTAFMRKPYGLASIFTLQGTRAQMREIVPATKRFLLERGGFERCKIKEERIIGWWLSNPSVSLPPVIDEVSFG